jgi:hypothetical protein
MYFEKGAAKKKFEFFLTFFQVSWLDHQHDFVNRFSTTSMASKTPCQWTSSSSSRTLIC